MARSSIEMFPRPVVPDGSQSDLRSRNDYISGHAATVENDKNADFSDTAELANGTSCMPRDGADYGCGPDKFISRSARNTLP